MGDDGRFLIVKNSSREGPGLLDEVLRVNNVAYDLVDLERGEPFPSPKAYDALIVLGGPDSANDENEKMQVELSSIKECLDLGKPYLGICLGLQTLVKAAGGSVVGSSVAEVGFRDSNNEHFEVVLSSEGREDRLFFGLGDRFRVFQLHGETVELTDGMALLGTGKHCANQVVRVGQNAYGLQCHFELTPSMLEKWLAEDEVLREMDRQRLLDDFEDLGMEYIETGRRLLANFVDIALW